MPIDLMHRLKISTASASALRLEEWGAEVLFINRTPRLAKF
ncbi:MAG: hypothetical protein ACM3SM_12700 [Bacteroidota bacterium]